MGIGSGWSCNADMSSLVDVRISEKTFPHYKIFGYRFRDGMRELGCHARMRELGFLCPDAES